MVLRCSLVLFLVSVVGCGAAYEGSSAEVILGQQTESVAVLKQGEAATAADLDGDKLSADTIAPSDRKIIYHAHILIDVVDFVETADAVDSLTSQHGGFIASSRLSGQSGSARSGQWTLRVPVEQYRSFVKELARLGELREQNETSKEVTAEFMDLQARIRNKEQEEQRLLRHLDETAEELSEILAVEKELSRVRGEVEQMQGRLKLLADQTSLSTVDVTVHEIKRFVPAESPTFTTRIARAWNGSTENLVNYLEGAAIVATALFPWLVVLGIVGGVVLLISVVVRRRSNAPAA